jgi:hypothetical protein
MLDHFFRRASVRKRIAANPIGPMLLQLVEHLGARGHDPGVLHQYVFAAEHFGASSTTSNPTPISATSSAFAELAGPPGPGARTPQLDEDLEDKDAQQRLDANIFRRVSLGSFD